MVPAARAAAGEFFNGLLTNLDRFWIDEIHAGGLKKLDQQGFEVFVAVVEPKANFPQVQVEEFAR
ncbi:hypothetical protein, partial [Methylococcus capsulatus]|uniref:hypothetical protein n=1 Tax=Methylococcus capsulatus TaxID=414 RepID=UPI002FD90C12